MRVLEATVYRIDGSAYVERTERDDPAGRRDLDRWAGPVLASPGVIRIAVEVVTGRTGGYTRSR